MNKGNLLFLTTALTATMFQASASNEMAGTSPDPQEINHNFKRYKWKKVFDLTEIQDTLFKDMLLKEIELLEEYDVGKSLAETVCHEQKTEPPAPYWARENRILLTADNSKPTGYSPVYDNHLYQVSINFNLNDLSVQGHIVKDRVMPLDLGTVFVRELARAVYADYYEIDLEDEQKRIKQLEQTCDSLKEHFQDHPKYQEYAHHQKAFELMDQYFYNFEKDGGRYHAPVTRQSMDFQDSVFFAIAQNAAQQLMRLRTYIYMDDKIGSTFRTYEENMKELNELRNHDNWAMHWVNKYRFERGIDQAYWLHRYDETVVRSFDKQGIATSMTIGKFSQPTMEVKNEEASERPPSPLKKLRPDW